MEVKYNEKLILKAIKQAIASMKMEELIFSKEEVTKIEEKIKVKILERSK